MKKIMYPCDICGKKHQWLKPVVIDYRGKAISTVEVHSPCLDKITKQATGTLNKQIKGG